MSEPTTTGGALTRDAILAADDLQLERVDVEEWGGHVWVCTMTAGERDSFDMAHTENVKANAAKPPHERNYDFRAGLLARVIVNERGERVFTMADVSALAKKSARAMEKVVNVALRLNGLSPDDVAALEKN